MPEKIEHFLPWVLIGSAFLAVSFLVWLTGGNSYWIRKKLRLGGILLTLTASAAGLASCDDVDCYDDTTNLSILALSPSVQKDSFTITDSVPNEEEQIQEITISSSGIREITGTLENHSTDEYSYAILDDEENILQQADLEPDDESFDSDEESFTLAIESELSIGTYRLIFFAGNTEDIDPLEAESIIDFRLIITDETIPEKENETTAESDT